MWAVDADADAHEVNISFLEYKGNGFWDFPEKRKELQVEVRFLFFGPVTPVEVSRRGYRFKEDEECAGIYNVMKRLK